MFWLRKAVPVWLLLIVVIGIVVAANFSLIATSLKTAFSPKPDFTLTASPNPAPILVGSSTHHGTMIKIGAVNGFAGEVDTTISSSSEGLIISASGGESAFFPGPDQNFNLTFVTSIGIGNYSVMVTGTSGKLSHSVNVSVVAQGLALDPRQINVTSGSTTVSKVTIASLNGLAGDFGVYYAPEVPPTINPEFSVSGTSNVVLAAGRNSTLTITVTSVLGFRGASLAVGVITPLGDVGIVLTIVAA